MVSLHNGYFDESAAGLGQKIFCVGGYVVKSTVATKMTEAWLSALAKYDVSVFHMKDCAHGNGEYRHLPVEERSLLVSELIAIIHTHITFGLTVSLNLSQYEKNPLPIKSGGVHNYMQLCTFILLNHVPRVMTDEKIDGKVLYAFEAGHHLEKSADALIRDVIRERKGAIYDRYAGHSYLPKSNVVLLQAADLLVWLTTKNLKNMVIGRPDRKDFLALTAGGIHYGANVFLKDGVLMIAETTPHFTGDPRPGAMAMRQLHSGDTPTVKLGGWRFDPGHPPRWDVN